MHLAPNTLLQGRYRIQRLIAQGGMGAVYQARDERLGHTVALKQTLVTDPQLRAAFEREARLLAGLHHPALPVVSDHFAEGSEQFLVMQFIPGDDLATMLQQRGSPFTLAEVLPWADRLLDALDYLHTQNPPIIHRDIKPLNLKLTARGEIILLDFGLAKGSAGQPAAGQSAATAARSIFGYTPQYAPLEQIKGSGTDPRSDLYSTAATFYELLTGSPPPDALTRAAALVVGQADPLVPAHVLRPDLPPALGGLLLQAMAMQPDQRPASAVAMRSVLQGTLQPGASAVAAATVAAGSSSAGQATIVMAGGPSAGEATVALGTVAAGGPVPPPNSPPSPARSPKNFNPALIFGSAGLLALVIIGIVLTMTLTNQGSSGSNPAVSTPVGSGGGTGGAVGPTGSGGNTTSGQTNEVRVGSRGRPLAPDAVATLPGWEVRILEYIRGDDAWRMMEQKNQFNDPPPDGFEYLLLKLEIRTNFSGEPRQLYPEVVGSRRVEYSRDGVPPDPAFPSGEIAGDRHIEGFIPFFVAIEEDNLLLKIDELLAMEAVEPMFIALEAGNALPDDPDLLEIEPNRVGADPREPASLNERAILEDWEVTVREVVRGEEALDRLIIEYKAVERPANGREYALAYVEVRYIGDGGYGDDTEQADRNLFKSGTLVDGKVQLVDVPSVYILPEPELDHWLYPGGTAAGWVVIDLPAGDPEAFLVFVGDRFDSDPFNTRYISLQ